jgi:purine nucleosidase
MDEKPLVLFDHDGGVDDYLSAMLLMTYGHLDVLGIVVTPADCYVNAAVSATRKILHLMGHSRVPVAQSTVRGVHPFPRENRRDSICIDHFPNLNEREQTETPLAEETGQQFMINALRAAPRPVTLLVTGPLSTVAAALDQAPDVEGQIERILWMGGALNVRGNVRDSEHNGSAEWNVYWDPPAAGRVWASQIPLILCPLDITNHVPLTSDFIRKLGRQRKHPLSDLAGHCYALVSHQPYYFWDVLTTAYLGVPELFELRAWETELLLDPPSQGRTAVREGGRKVTALDKVDVEAFYQHMLTQWAS